MLRFFLGLVLLAVTCAAQAQLPVFSIQFETLRIPFAKGMGWDGSAKPVEATILGKFYPQGGQPVIRAEDAGANAGRSPYVLLACFLRAAQEGREEEMAALYSPESQAVVAAFLADPEIRQMQAEALGRLQTLTVLGGWIQVPNRYILYTRTNGETIGVMPFMFEWIGGRWYLCAGRLEAQLSNQLDVFYFNPDVNAPQLELIAPPAPEAVRSLLAEEGMAEFAVQLGVVSPAGRSGRK